jgi:hypothetical protein
MLTHLKCMRVAPFRLQPSPNRSMKFSVKQNRFSADSSAVPKAVTKFMGFSS